LHNNIDCHLDVKEGVMRWISAKGKARHYWIVPGLCID
jgi:hypothetical protein